MENLTNNNKEAHPWETEEGERERGRRCVLPGHYKIKAETLFFLLTDTPIYPAEPASYRMPLTEEGY